MSENFWWPVFASFFVATILTLLPMPDWTIWLRPSWVLMVLMYWVMTAPQRVNFGVAFFVGIILDVLNGTLLGEHALALTIVTFFVARLHTQLRMYPLVQQGLWVFLFVMLNQFILFCVQGFIGELPKTWLYWAPSITSLLLWPWVFTIMRDYRRKVNTP